MTLVMISIDLRLDMPQLETGPVGKLPSMGTDLVLSTGKKFVINDPGALHQLIELRVGAAKQHPTPMLPMLLYVRSEIPQQKLALAAPTRTTKEQLVHETGTNRLFLRSRLGLPGHFL